MPQSKALATAQAVVGPGEWHQLNPAFPNRGFIVSLQGANATANVDIEVSNDGGATFSTRMSFNSVSVASSDVDPNQPFPSVRHNVRSLSAGATVTTTVTAAEGRPV